MTSFLDTFSLEPSFLYSDNILYSVRLSYCQYKTAHTKYGDTFGSEKTLKVLE